MGDGIGLLLMVPQDEPITSRLPKGWTTYWTRLDRWMRNGVVFDEDNGMQAPPGEQTIFNRDGGNKEGPR